VRLLLPLDLSLLLLDQGLLLLLPKIGGRPVQVHVAFLVAAVKDVLQQPRRRLVEVRHAGLGAVEPLLHDVDTLEVGLKYEHGKVAHGVAEVLQPLQAVEHDDVSPFPGSSPAGGGRRFQTLATCC
jgi:hypothetical protein